MANIKLQNSKSSTNGYFVAFELNSFSKEHFKIGIERDLFSVTVKNHANPGNEKNINKEFQYNVIRRSFHLQKATEKK